MEVVSASLDLFSAGVGASVLSIQRPAAAGSGSTTPTSVQAHRRSCVARFAWP